MKNISRGHRTGAPDVGVYTISTAAAIVGVGVQSLRAYESRGLLHPDRTSGGTRKYSDDDLTRLARIHSLLADGVNLAGISMVLDLEDENARLREHLEPKE